MRARFALGFLVALAACGLDEKGSMQLTELTADGSTPEPTPHPREAADAAIEDAAVADTGVDAAPPDACLLPAAALCVSFDGTTVDRSTHARKLEVTGRTATFIQGARGQAVVVDNGIRIRIANDDAWVAGPLTLEARFKFTAPVGTGQRAMILDKDGSFGMWLLPSGDVVCAQGGNTLTAGPVTEGRWTHLACVNDGKKVAFYIDGSLKASVDSSFYSLANSILALGSNSPDGDPLTGALDEIRIFQAARTPEQILAAAKQP
jgi:hypothetical protein